jgi:serine/threonine-protein kinase
VSDSTLLDLVVTVLETGCTPEDACRDSPHLLAEVRAHLRRVRSIDGHVDALFPGTESEALEAAATLRGVEALPHVPGHDVLSLLGHGGMGVVYAARHRKLDRTVAVKMLLGGVHTDPVGLKRLVREAESVAALRHPNIVQVHEVGEHDGLPYFTMELVEGGSLRDRLEGKVLDAREAATLVSTLAEAMEVAHASGIVHRDLKPANVLFTPGGVPKIVDFGLARRIEAESSLTLTDARLGTPSYMAPEQARGGARDVGPAADVYALGAILYATLTGRPPFHSDVQAATLLQVIRDEPVRPSRLNPRVPRDLETICLRCLAKEPARRYAGAAALAADLRRFVRGEPIVARPIGWLERTGKWARRRPAHATIVAGSVVAVLAIVGVGLWLGVQRAAVERAAEEDLSELDREAAAENWPRARTALEKARARLTGGSFEELTARVSEGARDLALAEKLEAIRERQLVLESDRFEGDEDPADADPAYAAAFLELGLVDVPGHPREVADRIRSSRIRSVLVSAVDTWAIHVRGDGARRDGLLEVVRLVDPDITGWRERVRDPASWQDPRVLGELASAAPVSEAPVPMLLILAEHLVRARADPVPFLERVQQAHPGDYWANATLGARLAQRSPGVAVRYFQAATALRPGSTIARGNLGIVLATSGRRDEAIAQFRDAIAIDPANARAHVALSACFQWNARFTEAIEELRTAMRVDPRVTSYLLGQTSTDMRDSIATDSLSRAHESLGRIVQTMGDQDGAITCFREALRFDPDRSAPRAELAKALVARGSFDEARAEAKQFLESHPADDPGRKGARVLLDHCERVHALAAELPAILDGTRVPMDGAESLAFADLFRARREDARAVRHFTDAFERGVGTPIRDANWRTADAARCAALAAAGSSGAGAQPSDAERAEWRARAYEWLRIELGALHGVLGDHAAEYGRFVLRTLEDWRRERAFARVRDDEHLAGLPDDERARWKKLWSAAGTLAARAKKAVR